MTDLLPREQVIVERRTATPRRPADPIVVAQLADTNALTLDDFEIALPSAAMLEEFRDAKGNLAPRLYWEMVAPGMVLQLLPRVPGIVSSPDGLWFCRNPYEEALVRRRHGQMADQLRVNMEEYRAAQKDADNWLECQNCPVRTTSTFAIKLHTRHWKHTMA